MNTQDWSLLGWTWWISLLSKGLARVFSNTAVQNHQFFCAAGFSSYDGDLSLPLGLALGSPLVPSGCEGKLGVALESLQGGGLFSSWGAGAPCCGGFSCAEHGLSSQRNDTFELWCWRRLLRVPWTARRSNQSSLEEIKSEYTLEGTRQCCCGCFVGSGQ